MNIREKWFIDRIGKRVYRNDDKCSCESCKNVYTHGLIIQDELHASYLDSIEACYNAEGIPLRYFDTLDEVNEYEKNINNSNRMVG